MSTIEELRDERATLIARSKSIVERAQAQGRENLATDEYTKVSESVERVKQLDRQIKGRQLVQSVVGLGPADIDAGLDSGGSRVFTPEDSKGLVTAIRTRSNYRAEVPAKAAITGGTLLPPQGQGASPACSPTGSWRCRPCSPARQCQLRLSGTTS